MWNDTVIVDAVVHPYDLSPANQDPASRAQLDAVYAAHRLTIDEAHKEYILSHDEFFSDFSYDAMAVAEFVESPVDFAVIHALPNLGFCKGDVTSPARSAALRDRHPNRFRLFATVDTPDLPKAIAQLEHQVKDFHVDGLKLYPAFFYDGKAEGWRLDAPDFATPLLQAAHGLGIRNVAIHKSLWLKPAPREAFNVDDLGLPLDRFPDMTFQIVHGGVAFLDETIALLERHQNLYITLETMINYILVKPKLFAKILGGLLKAGGSERLLFATGNNLTHPRPLIEAFIDYEFPEEYRAEFNLPQLTAQDRRNILGLNTLRLNGLDPAAIIAQTRDDEFARARREAVPAPWSLLRGATAEAAA